jgi:DNA-binding MarR family transcriptional regulator
VAPSKSDYPKNANNSEPVIAEIMSLLSKVSERLEPENLGMRQWMIQNFQNPKIAELIQDSTLMMLRVLDAIGRLEPVNGITISKEFRIPKGSVSKTTRRLIAKKLIKAEARPNNKKEILYHTTALGRELFQAHRAFDEQMEKGFIQFLERYDTKELKFMVRALQDFLNVSFLSEETESKA